MVICRYMGLMKDSANSPKYIPSVPPSEQKSEEGDMLQQAGALISSVVSPSMFNTLHSIRMWHHFVCVLLCLHVRGWGILGIYVFTFTFLHFFASGDEVFVTLRSLMSKISKYWKIWGKVPPLRVRMMNCFSDSHIYVWAEALVNVCAEVNTLTQHKLYLFANTTPMLTSLVPSIVLYCKGNQ